MTTYQDAIVLAVRQGDWVLKEERFRESDNTLLEKIEMTAVNDMDLWTTLRYPQQVIVTRYTQWDEASEKYIERYGVLASTRRYRDPRVASECYGLRMQTEERFRQFKRDWYIAEFPSPHAALIESHVCFTLFTYSLLQLYLRRKDLRAKTQQMISTLRADESLGKDAVLIYSRDRYGVFDLDDY